MCPAKWSRSLPVWAQWAIACAAFVATNAAFLPVSLRLTDQFTHCPVGPLGRGNPFPILVLDERHATVKMIERAEDFGTLPGSYVVPPGREAAVLTDIRQQDEGLSLDATWTLKVRRSSANRQRIELVRMGDGLWGGVYDATPNGVTPLYRKVTGPGFAFIFGGLGLVLSCCCWGCGWMLVRAWRSRPARRDGIPSP